MSYIIIHTYGILSSKLHSSPLVIA